MHPEMARKIELYLTKIEDVAERLRLKIHPAHADFISKDGAAAIIEDHVKTIRTFMAISSPTIIRT